MQLTTSLHFFSFLLLFTLCNYRTTVFPFSILASNDLAPYSSRKRRCTKDVSPTKLQSAGNVVETRRDRCCHRADCRVVVPAVRGQGRHEEDRGLLQKARSQQKVDIHADHLDGFFRSSVSKQIEGGMVVLRSSRDESHVPDSLKILRLITLCVSQKCVKRARA